MRQRCLRLAKAPENNTFSKTVAAPAEVSLAQCVKGFRFMQTTTVELCTDVQRSCTAGRQTELRAESRATSDETREGEVSPENL